jgi:hypothetical protein
MKVTNSWGRFFSFIFLTSVTIFVLSQIHDTYVTAKAAQNREKMRLEAVEKAYKIWASSEEGQKVLAKIYAQ